MKKLKGQITDRDFEILIFLWRWKVATTATIVTKFFAGSSGKTGYNRLLALEKNGVLFYRNAFSGHGGAWCLTADGFERMRGKIFGLKEDGFKSEYPGHDLLVSAFHNGEWLIETPPCVEVFTEQELRRLNPESYPDWVPKLDTHRPDGYFRVPIGNQERTIAIEVELHHKSVDQYVSVASFYQFARSVERVIWLTSTSSFGRTLNAHLQREDRRDTYPHAFVSFSKFKDLGWDARIEFGRDEGKRIFEILDPSQGTGPEVGGQTERSLTKLRLTEVLLTVSKSANKSMTPEVFDLGTFAYRYGV